MQTTVQVCSGSKTWHGSTTCCVRLLLLLQAALRPIPPVPVIPPEDRVTVERAEEGRQVLAEQVGDIEPVFSSSPRRRPWHKRLFKRH
jgi:hypothetical protein